MLLFPQEFRGIKMGVMFVILLSISKLILENKGKIQFDKFLFTWFFIYFLIGLLPILIGFIRKNPASEKYITVYLLWVVLYFIFSVGISYRPNILMELIRVLKIALILISITGICAFLVYNFYPGLNAVVLFFFDPNYRPGYKFTAIDAQCSVSFIYLFTFYLTSFFVENVKIKVSQLLIILTGIIFAIATSKRILLFLIALFPFILFIFLLLVGNKSKLNIFTRKAIYMFSIIIFMFIINIPLQFIDLSSIVQYTKSAFHVNKEKQAVERISKGDGTYIIDDGANIRTKQIKSLVEGWKNNPIFGAGAGINASVVRSELPGTYEMTYHAMLFERGILGLTLFVILIACLNLIGIKLIRRESIYADYIIASIVAMDIFLVANATNPYLMAYDFMWTLFLPVALLNVAIVEPTRKLIHD